MAATLCELVEREENKLTIFSTWTIMLGCYESNVIFQQHHCKLVQLVEIHKYSVKQSRRSLWPPHFRTFCELVEWEENKLTIFSTWTIYNVRVLCNFPAASLQTWATGRNSQVFGQAIKKTFMAATLSYFL